MSDMTIQIHDQNWYIVETHPIPDKNEVENLTDLNVDAKQQKYYGLNIISTNTIVSSC
jgi:hypothetical protein